MGRRASGGRGGGGGARLIVDGVEVDGEDDVVGGQRHDRRVQEGLVEVEDE